MKFALAFAFAAILIAVASAGLTCYTDETRCAEDECCIKVGNRLGSFTGVCMKLKLEGESCKIHQEKSLIKSHVYLSDCPCAGGMKCRDKDGLVGKVLGTCQAEEK